MDIQSDQYSILHSHLHSSHIYSKIIYTTYACLTDILEGLVVAPDLSGYAGELLLEHADLVLYKCKGIYICTVGV